MPERPSRIVSFDNFKGGEYGTKGGDSAPPNSFHAKNMLVYADGYIGPRPGIREITPASMPVGELLALATTEVSQATGTFVIGDTVYSFDLGNAATVPTALTGTFNETPEQPIVLHPETTDLLATVRYDPNTPDATYRLAYTPGGGGTVTEITDSPGGHDVLQYEQATVVAESQFTSRLFASSPTDPDDFSEGRFVDVGDNWQVTAMHVLRNGLAVLKRTGLYLLRGVIGDADSEYVLRVSTDRGPLHPWQADKDHSDRIWFWPLFRKHPAVFTGNPPEHLSHLDLPTREEDGTIADPPLKRGVKVLDGDASPETVVFVQSAASHLGIVYHNDVWTMHEFEEDISGMLASTLDLFVTTDGGGAATAANIYSCKFNLNRPAFTSDPVTQPGDNSNTPLDCELTLPQWWNQSGRDVTVRQVVVDFKSWATGAAETNHFELVVKSLGRNLSAEQTYASGTFDEAGASSSSSGTRRRKVFNVQCSPGSGFEISLSNIRGCAFKSIAVLGEGHDESPIS